MTSQQVRSPTEYSEMPNPPVDSTEKCDEDHGVSYSVLGKDIPVDPESQEIFINIGRIKKIEGLEKCAKLQSLCLISQRISVIENLENNTELRKLELYQNLVEKIENISFLTKLRHLDLSFNKIRKIENLENLVNLEILQMSGNAIPQISGLENLTRLRSLELGSNKIKCIENLNNLTNLEELWLGKNRISNLSIPKLEKLKRLSAQSNRLKGWDSSLFDCVNIEELYLGHNALTTIHPDIGNLEKLVVLDLAGNKISCLEPLRKCVNLKELWLNDNDVKDLNQILYLGELKSLETLYLERNPVQYFLGPGYRMKILEILSWIKQLDAMVISGTPKFTVRVTNYPKPVLKKKSQRVDLD